MSNDPFLIPAVEGVLILASGSTEPPAAYYGDVATLFVSGVADDAGEAWGVYIGHGRPYVVLNCHPDWAQWLLDRFASGLYDAYLLVGPSPTESAT